MYGLVETEREGQEIYYSVRMEGLVGTLRSLADSLEATTLITAATITASRKGVAMADAAVQPDHQHLLAPFLLRQSQFLDIGRA